MRRATALLLTLSLSLTPALATAGTTLGGETPQAVVERMNKAAAKKDIAEITACLDAESRAEMAAGMLVGVVMMVAFMGMGAEMASGMAEGMSEATGDSKAEAKKKADAGKAEAAAKMEKTKKELSAVLKKHGLPDLMDEGAIDKAGDPKVMLAKADQPALVADLMGIMNGLGEGKESEGDGNLPDVKNVTDYKITGDKATAKAGAETLDFVKENGRWFLKAPEKKAAPEGDAKPE